MAKITNPIIPSDYPDVDVIRVEDTYYMVSTTMHFMPGAVILRSYDLGHWETISHIYTELTDAPAYHLDDGKLMDRACGPLAFAGIRELFMSYFPSMIYIKRFILYK